jgi:hypothetical protein
MMFILQLHYELVDVLVTFVAKYLFDFLREFV